MSVDISSMAALFLYLIGGSLLVALGFAMVAMGLAIFDGMRVLLGMVLCRAIDAWFSLQGRWKKWRAQP